MFGRETRMLLRHYLEQGTSKSALARQLGVSRDTIHRWIRDGDLDRDLDDDAGAVRAAARRCRPSSTPTKPIIETRLAAYPELSAVRLLDGDPRRGLRGRLHAAERVRASGAPDAAARAGHPLRDAGGPPGAGRLRAILGFRGACATRCSSCSATRGCCGAGSIRARTCATLIDGLEDAFRYFGGVPQELLFDQMKAVITRDLRLAGRRAGAQSRVSPLRAPLGLHAARVPAVSRADQGQSRAAGPLPARQFRLRPDVCSMMPISISSGGTGSTTSPMCGVHATTRERPRDRFDRDERCLLQPLAPRPLHVADPRAGRAASTPRRPRRRVRWSPSRSGRSPCTPASREVLA